MNIVLQAFPMMVKSSTQCRIPGLLMPTLVQCSSPLRRRLAASRCHRFCHCLGGLCSRGGRASVSAIGAGGGGRGEMSSRRWGDRQGTAAICVGSDF